MTPRTSIALPAKTALDDLLMLCHNEPHCMALNSNAHPSAFDWLLFVGAEGDVLRCTNAANAFHGLRNAVNEHPDWWYGWMAYDLKNALETLPDALPDPVEFPVMHFARPYWVVSARGEEVVAHVLPHQLKNFNRWLNSHPLQAQPTFAARQLEVHMPASLYREAASALMANINRGDIYEVNLCRGFSAEFSGSPLGLYQRLNELTQAPFSGFVQAGDFAIACGSPERYLSKTGMRLVSQPIKGTAPRHPDPVRDLAIRTELLANPKERRENIMITDLVRNDLSRVAAPNSVHVDELLGLYSFNTVHQLISTVSATLRSSLHPTAAIEASFPMGSMTGAPKVRAMELIHRWEPVSRSVYSGAMGYFTPAMDFDFNVIIRSVLVNSRLHRCAFYAGGALTSMSIIDDEFAETELKARAMLNALGL